MSSPTARRAAPDTRRVVALAAAAALALPAILYLVTLYPGIGDRAASGDAVELQTVGRVLGVAHEPGYPQYVLLSFLWSWVPLPLTLATKINLLSGIFALAAGAFHFAATRAVGAGPIATILATWALLTAPDLWLLATQAEVYALHVLWVAIFFWSALRWRRSGSRAHLLWLLFGYALAFGNHLTMITLLPALAVLLLTRQPRLAADGSAWRWAGIAAATGAAQYLLLVWRSYFPHPTLLERFPLRAGPGGLLAYVTGDRFVEKHWLPAGGGEWLARIGEALTHGAGQLTPVFAAVAVYGVFAAWRRDPGRAAFLLVAAASVLLFAAAYDIRDWLLYCIPAWVVAAIFAAEGTERLMKRHPRVGLVIVFVLSLSLGPRIVRGVEELRVVGGNPTDLTTVLPALPPNARVLPAGGQRLSRLHEHYYRYGVGIEIAPEMRFLSARQDVLQRALHLRYRNFFFRSPTVAKIFGGRLIDYRVWPGWRGRGGDVLVTGTTEPVAEVGLRALPGELELTVREARRTLGDEKDLYLFFVGSRDGRAKGLEALDLSAKGGEQRLRQLLETLPDGDLVVLIVPTLGDGARRPVTEVLATAGGGPIGDSTRRFVAAWRKGDQARGVVLWEEPEDGAAWTVHLAGL